MNRARALAVAGLALSLTVGGTGLASAAVTPPIVPLPPAVVTQICAATSIETVNSVLVQVGSAIPAPLVNLVSLPTPTAAAPTVNALVQLDTVKQAVNCVLITSTATPTVTPTPTPTVTTTPAPTVTASATEAATATSTMTVDPVPVVSAPVGGVETGYGPA